MRSMLFKRGQLVYHRKLHYRGVVADLETEDSQEEARYLMLVHNRDKELSVKERDLEPDVSGEPIENPQLHLYFDVFEDGCYAVRGPLH